MFDFNLINGRTQSDEIIGMTRKLGIDYVNFIKECWVHASVCPFHVTCRLVSVS
jgi:hypothetical protein